MALALLLLIQLVILVVVDLRFALVCIYVYRSINQRVSSSFLTSGTCWTKRKKNKGRTLTVVRLAQRGSSAAYVEGTAGAEICWAETKRGRSRAESKSGEEGHY